MAVSLTLHTLSSLAKVFTDEIFGDPFSEGSLLKNEEYSYQVAYTLEHPERYNCELTVEIDSPLAEFITLRQVVNVPSESPIYLSGADDNYLRTGPGLFPDPLFPLDGNEVLGVHRILHTLWITVKPEESFEAGSYPVRIVFKNEKADILEVSEVTLEIIDALLPVQELIFTQWFHADCIASYYRLDVFCEKHWEWIEKFMKTAADNGMNMILTPVFTLPLDTKVGGERPTTQLVDVTRTDGHWFFGFEKLARWCEMALRVGFSYIEISHLFTQWGAFNAPKIMAVADGEYKQVFGWNTDAAGTEYTEFLDAFLPALTAFLEERSYAKRCWFHVSDEPNDYAMESYQSAVNIMKKHLRGYRMLDALTVYEFYENGMVQTPAVANSHIETFLEHGVKPLWAYYCCVQCIDVSNRFFSMPSARNRIIAEQLYKYEIEGFLHWGYNFYYSQFSRWEVNPFLTTDAMNAFPSGDAYSVYPGENSVIESLRLKVFHEALQDLRAMRLLESRIGREKVMELIETGSKPITFSKYPKEESYILNLRKAINKRIKETNS